MCYTNMLSYVSSNGRAKLAPQEGLMFNYPDHHEILIKTSKFLAAPQTLSLPISPTNPCANIHTTVELVILNEEISILSAEKTTLFLDSLLSTWLISSSFTPKEGVWRDLTEPRANVQR